MATTSQDHAHAQLIDALHGIRGKVRVLSVAFGAGVVLASAVGALLATVLIDWTLNLPGIPRICVDVLALAGLGYAIYRGLVRPLLSKLSISDVAGRLEHAFPTFDDRLRSTVDFVRTDVPGSDTMKDRVVFEATQIAKEVDLPRALVVRPVVYSLAGGVAAVGLVVLLSLVFPFYSGIAGQRLLHPFTGPQWPKRVQIASDPLPLRVPLGQHIPITMKLKKGDKPGMEARIYYQYDNGPVEHDIMTRGENGTYTASLDANGSQLKVWMAAGDDQTQPQIISVVPRLEIQSVEMDVKAPPYAKLDMQTLNLSAGPAMMVDGSKLALRVTFNKPLDPKVPVTLEPASPEFNGKIPAAAWNRAAENAPVASWTAKDSFRFHVIARDQDGFSNKGLEEYEVIVRPDQMPSVVIELPRRDEEYTPQATVKLQVHAEDDFGISTMKLMVDRDASSSTTRPAGAPNHWEVALADWQLLDSSGDRLRYRLNYPWELSELTGADLKPGDVLHYYVTVTDNYDLENPENPSGPHLTHPAVASGKLRITIISQDTLNDQALQVTEQVAKKTAEVQKAQDNTRLRTMQLQDDSKGKSEFNQGDRETAAQIVNQQSTVTSQTKQLSETLENLEQRLKDNKFDRPELPKLVHDVKEELSQTAENPMKQAAEKVDQAKDQKADPKASPQDQQKAGQQRDQAMEQAQQSQQQASKELQQAMNKLSTVGSIQKAIDAFQKALEDQQKMEKQTKDFGNQHLGQDPKDMKPEDQKKKDELADKQEEQKKQVEKATNEMDKAGDQMKKSDPDAAKAMKEAAEQSKSQGIAQNQKSASDDIKQNKSRPAVDAEQAAELGLNVVLSTLRREQLRQLEKLKEQLADAEKKIQELIARQADHNINNLELQGPDKAKLITDDLKKEAKRTELVQPPPPALPQQTASQEQTEQNTRGVATDVDSLPDSTDIVAHLTRAAGKMVYAIVSLRDDKLEQPQRLASAYDPHQTAALASLEEALKVVQKQKADTDKKLDDAQKEKIRDALIEIRNDQTAINKTTTDIDAAPRLADGSLKREQDLQVKPLPGDQQKLVDRIKKDVDAGLQALGAVEFSSASDEVKATMGHVKDELAKPATGEQTQVEEVAVVDELTAMIDALQVRPPDPKEFEDPNGGGGGGGGGGDKPKMPSEVELRLMKARQLVINKLTKLLSASKDPSKNKPVAIDLGERQATLRNNLAKLLEKAGNKNGLGPEPTRKEIDSLPEVAGDEAIEDQELEHDLLKGQPTDDKVQKDFTRVGDRMSASKMRLEENNPGQTTQKIQDKIVMNLDDLIQIARQQSQAKPKPGKPKPGEKPGEGPPQQADNQGDGQKPGQPKKGGSTPAQDDKTSPANENNVTLGEDMKNVASEWGATSPRMHDAVVEGASEKVIPKYEKLVEDYYRSLATQTKTTNP